MRAYGRSPTSSLFLCSLLSDAPEPTSGRPASTSPPLEGSRCRPLPYAVRRVQDKTVEHLASVTKSEALHQTTDRPYRKTWHIRPPRRVGEAFDKIDPTHRGPKRAEHKCRVASISDVGGCTAGGIGSSDGERKINVLEAGQIEQKDVSSWSRGE